MNNLHKLLSTNEFCSDCVQLQKSSDGKESAFQPNILMLGFSPSSYVLRAISAVRPSDLEQALLVSV